MEKINFIYSKYCSLNDDWEELIIENGIEYRVEHSFLSTRWWYDGKKHRELGPAVKYFDGEKIWYKHGKIHREDGPAIITNYGQEEYYYNGIFYSNIKNLEEFNEAIIKDIIE